MTINEIKTLQLAPSALFRTLTTSHIRSAIEEELTLETLSAPSIYEYKDEEGKVVKTEPGPGMSWGYAKDFTTAMVDYICNSFQRRDPMDKDERKELAELILRRNLELTIADCRLFADMVIAGEINTGRPGQDEYKLIDVTKSGILDKLRAYKDYRRNFEHTYRQMQIMPQKEVKKEKTPLTDWMLTHDYEGNLMKPGWNAEAYWRGVPTEIELDTIILPRIRMHIGQFLTQNKV